MNAINSFRLGLVSLLLLGLPPGTRAQTNPGWTLIWADEFSQPDGSSPDPGKWAYDLGAGGWGNNELQYYTARTNNVRIENQQLVIEARAENYLGANYTSARLKTQGKVSWRYGRFEARIKVPRGQGIWPAFWMLGTNITSVNWPNCGEIDILENIGREPKIVHGTVHGPGYSGGGGIGGSYSLSNNADFADAFHVYAVEWTTNQIKWFVNDQQYFSITPARLPAGANWVFTQPQFLLLNLAVGGNWPGNPDGTTVFPQRLIVDYVRVYAATNLPDCGANLLSNPGLETGSLAGWSAYGAGFNTLAESSTAVPVHDGHHCFKVFGQFSGGDNYSGLLQNIPVTPGQSLTASGWAFTPGNDRIAGANTAWLELSFRDAGANVVSLYRSAALTASSPPGAWLPLGITNQFNPTTFAPLGSVPILTVPPTATTARFQIVFRQPATAAGAVLFDDLKLTSGPVPAYPVPLIATRAGPALELRFPTYRDRPYEVRWSSDLTNPAWSVLTNLAGTGTEWQLAVNTTAEARFFQVFRWCN